MNKFNTHEFYKHDNTLDVVLYVNRIVWEQPDHVVLNVDYTDLKHNKVFWSKDIIRINKKDFPKWKIHSA